MQKDRLESFSFLGLFAVISLLLFFVFAPFIQILAFAAVFAALCHAPYERLARALGGQKSIAAILTVALALVFFIVPFFFLGLQILREAQGLYAGAYGNGPHYVRAIQAVINGPVQRFLPGFSFDINAYIGSVLTFISSNLASLVSQTFYVVLETFLMLLAFFFFLRDGRNLLASVAGMSPFGKSETTEILAKMYQTIQSVLKGTLFVAVIRWILIGAGFFLFGIPNAALWSSIGGIIGAIPGLGTPFVFIPAIAYLYLGGNMLGAFGLAIFGIAVIIAADNILTPYFFGKGLEVPQIFVLFSILGGIIFFGPLGFILGPLVLSVFLSVLRIYAVVDRRHT
jgi:predicted PurR-regulated permease PerM